jgi:tripartite ATP-independent transporter DctM subunit
MDLAILLILLLVAALFVGLAFGYPVAFTMPAAATLVGLIALYLTAQGVDLGLKPAHIEGAPALPIRFQWATTFGNIQARIVGIFSAERDLLIAVPLFVFMGVMLERSQVAEDLLDTMGTLFGPVPAGLGISVVAVGALLAASTGIVGATVVTMGMISLPTMLRRGYAKGLSTGVICASGTLGQIIPPSIVLVLLADQLSNAVPLANDVIRARYQAENPGSFAVPLDLMVPGATVGDIFAAAILPGLILVGLYALYQLVLAAIRPRSAPRIPVSELETLREPGFVLRIFKVLIAPLVLIVAVLGTILGGVAPTTEAASVGAAGTILLAGQRLMPNPRRGWLLFGVGFGAMVFLLLLRYLGDGRFSGGETLFRLDFYIESRSTLDLVMQVLSGLVLALLLAFIAWGLWVIYRAPKGSGGDTASLPDASSAGNTLIEVMRTTLRTSSMVFVIFIGAQLLSLVFRGLGGDEYVAAFLNSLPGGFWGMFLAVMLLLFVLGFFLDFIEITLIVIPIIAPVILSHPDVSVTAVWLAIMIAMNLQTSFLTPPFGFALFYLRGVAKDTAPEITTRHIYAGVAPFIALQVVALLLLALVPEVVDGGRPALPNLIFGLALVASGLGVAVLLGLGGPTRRRAVTP